MVGPLPWRLRLRRFLVSLAFGLGLALVFFGFCVGFAVIALGDSMLSVMLVIFAAAHAGWLLIGGTVAHYRRRATGSLAHRAAVLAGWTTAFSSAAMGLAFVVAGALKSWSPDGLDGIVVGAAGAAIIGLPVFIVAALWSALYLRWFDRLSPN